MLYHPKRALHSQTAGWWNFDGIVSFSLGTGKMDNRIITKEVKTVLNFLMATQIQTGMICPAVLKITSSVRFQTKLKAFTPPLILMYVRKKEFTFMLFYLVKLQVTFTRVIKFYTEAFWCLLSCLLIFQHTVWRRRGSDYWSVVLYFSCINSCVIQEVVNVIC